MLTPAIGVTNQRETSVVWDKLTGLPLYNAIGLAVATFPHFSVVGHADIGDRRPPCAHDADKRQETLPGHACDRG
jgi:hypothetical protein